MVFARLDIKQERAFKTQCFQGSLHVQGQKDSNPQQRFWRPAISMHTLLDIYGLERCPIKQMTSI